MPGRAEPMRWPDPLGCGSFGALAITVIEACSGGATRDLSTRPPFFFGEDDIDIYYIGKNFPCFYKKKKKHKNITNQQKRLNTVVNRMKRLSVPDLRTAYICLKYFYMLKA